MVRWQDVNIEAPIARAFIDRGLTTASHVITLVALAGLTAHVGHAPWPDAGCSIRWPMTAFLPKKFFAAIHPKFRTPYKNTIAVGLLAAIVAASHHR